MRKALVLLSAFLVFGCSSDDSLNESSMIPGLDYYKFTSTDKRDLPNSSLAKGRRITFTNQSGEKLHYRVTTNQKDRADDNTGTFSGGGIPSHYYDKQSINLQSEEFPDSENSGITLILYKPSASGLLASLYFDRWNDGGYWHKQTFAISNVSVSSETFNAKTYTKVVTLNSASTVSSIGDGFPLNANKIYYDFNFGIIGFDDLDGNQWRRD